MSINVIWDNPEKTIIRFIYNGDWTLDNFYDALEQAWSLQDKVHYTVHFIIDVQNSGFVPQGVLPHGRPVISRHHPNQGKSIIVGASTLIRALFQTFSKICAPRFEASMYGFAATLDEAREQLNARKPASVSTGPLRQIHR